MESPGEILKLLAPAHVWLWERALWARGVLGCGFQSPTGQLRITRARERKRREAKIEVRRRLSAGVTVPPGRHLRSSERGRSFGPLVQGAQGARLALAPGLGRPGRRDGREAAVPTLTWGRTRGPQP